MTRCPASRTGVSGGADRSSSGVAGRGHGKRWSVPVDGREPRRFSQFPPLRTPPCRGVTTWCFLRSRPGELRPLPGWLRFCGDSLSVVDVALPAAPRLLSALGWPELVAPLASAGAGACSWCSGAPWWWSRGGRRTSPAGSG